MSKIDFSLTLQTLDGRDQPLNDLEGRVLLITNTASQCGFTPQYAALEALWRRYREEGLTVMGFPCDQFAHQEPGNAEEIAAFCALTYDVTFPMFAKLEVNGPNTHPLFERIKLAAPGMLGSQGIKWNFTKFLVSRQGEVVGRWSPATKPAALEQKIKELLADQARR